MGVVDDVDGRMTLVDRASGIFSTSKQTGKKLSLRLSTCLRQQGGLLMLLYEVFMQGYSIGARKLYGQTKGNYSHFAFFDQFL